MKIKCLGLFLTIILAAAVSCNTAKNTGTTVKDGTVAATKEVADKAEDVGEATADVAGDVGSKVGETAKDVGKASANVAKGAAEETEDASITSAVKMKFADDDVVDAFDIDVDTHNGHVTLKGTVASHQEETLAVKLAQEAAGVKSVTSQLRIKNE